ncbi:MAG: DNA-3-methyladenine glycosylase 2 family protein, partial [Nitrolancea sp.]
LEIEAHGSKSATVDRSDVAREVARLLGTGLDLSDFYLLSNSDDQLAGLTERFRGFKPPRYPTLFECLTNAITCQLLSLNVGLRVVSRLVEHYGHRMAPGETPAFPTPAEIAPSDPDHLRSIGFSRQKARALIELAQNIDAGCIDLEAIANFDDETAIAHLTALRGVGRWTAEYALLRGMGRLHVFPGDDVGARNTLQKWARTEGPLNYAGVAELLDRWKPYAGLVYFHMLLLGIESKGRVATGA